MEQLVKEITTLHKVLTKYLSPSTVHGIMGQVLDASNDKLGEEYKKVEFKTEEAKKRYLHLVRMKEES
jgi:vacuolar protein sorting-associated protein 54